VKRFFPGPSFPEIHYPRRVSPVDGFFPDFQTVRASQGRLQAGGFAVTGKTGLGRFSQPVLSHGKDMLKDSKTRGVFFLTSVPHAFKVVSLPP